MYGVLVSLCDMMAFFFAVCANHLSCDGKFNSDLTKSFYCFRETEWPKATQEVMGLFQSNSHITTDHQRQLGQELKQVRIWKADVEADAKAMKGRLMWELM